MKLRKKFIYYAFCERELGVVISKLDTHSCKVAGSNLVFIKYHMKGGV